VQPVARGCHEVERREADVLGHCLRRRLRALVLQREEREPLAPVDLGDATRRPPAEPSVAVVEEQRPGQGLG
jgi:hypothetical protein